MSETRDWESLKLGDFANIVVGATPSRAVQRYWGSENSGHPWVSITDLRNRIVSETAEYITDAGVRGSAVSRVSAGTILMSFKLTIGRVAISGTDLYTNEAIVAIQPDPLRVDKGWLAHVLPQVASSEISDSAVKGATLNQKKLRLLEFSVPPLAEQRRIAEVLDAADGAIDASVACIEKLYLTKDGLVSTILSGLKCRASVGLSELSEVASGVTLGGSLVGSGSKFPCITVTNVQDGHLDLSEVKKIHLPESSSSRYLLHPGDFLMTEGGDFDKLGRGAVWNNEIEDCLYQNHIFRIRCNQSRLLPDFLSIYSASWHGKNYFRLASKQSTNLASINSTQVKEFPVPLISLEEQQRIISIVQAHDERIAAERARLEKLRKLKAGLMDDLFTGRVRVGRLDELPV